MMLARTTDIEDVWEILTDSAVYQHVTDDFAPEPGRFKPNEDPRIWYVAALDRKRPVGLFTLLPQNDICWEAHVAFLPEAWGKVAQTAGAGFLQWVWDQTPCRRIVCSIPAFNRLAIRYATRVVGVQEFGVNVKSFLKFGKLWDQHLLGASKPEAACRPS